MMKHFFLSLLAFILSLLAVVFLSCGEGRSSSNGTQAGTERHQPIATQDSPESPGTPITQKNSIIELYKEYRAEGLPIESSEGTDLSPQIMAVIDNYDKINAYTDWSDYGQSFFEEDDVLVEVKKYYQNNELVKITTEKYGSLGKSVVEYYLLNGNLSFRYEEKHEYNSPYDSKLFNTDISRVVEYARFFDKGTLFFRVIRDLERDMQVVDDDAEGLESDQADVMKLFAKILE